MVTVLKIFIKSYQKISHFFLPQTCRYYPTCSQYAISALDKYGFFKAIVKIALRIIKCSPFFKGGYDPA